MPGEKSAVGATKKVQLFVLLDENLEPVNGISLDQGIAALVHDPKILEAILEGLSVEMEQIEAEGTATTAAGIGTLVIPVDFSTEIDTAEVVRAALTRFATQHVAGGGASWDFVLYDKNPSDVGFDSFLNRVYEIIGLNANDNRHLAGPIRARGNSTAPDDKKKLYVRIENIAPAVGTNQFTVKLVGTQEH